MSLAIGKGGQNVRLAAKLTGWRIDIKGISGEVISSDSDEEDIEEAITEEESTEEAKKNVSEENDATIEESNEEKE